MANESLDELLARLPDIAKVVNEFKSESVQLKAFDAIIKKIGAASETATIDDEDGEEQQQEEEENVDFGQPQLKKGNATRAKQKAPKGGREKRREPEPKMVHDLNLRPKNDTSLKEFVEEKKPSTKEQTYAVIVYYLQRKLKLQHVTVDHVYTSLKELGGIKVSPRLRTILSNVGSNRGWFDARNKDEIKLTIHGENLVEHDLPPKAAAKKA